MSSTISPNMNLVIPGVGTEAGPTWASDINASLSVIDQHNHSSGSGVQINPSGLNINSDLTFNSFNAIQLRSVRFTPQPVALSGISDLGCLYEAGVDLYYNDGSGNQIQLTSGGSIVGTAGSISGLPSGTASASYSGGTFTWQSATSTAANMDAASYVLRNNSASSKGLTLQPPNSMAADYSLTLPLTPGAQSFLSIDPSGNIAQYCVVDGGIIGANIASATITGANLATDIAIPGNPTSGGRNIVVPSLSPGPVLSVMRGVIDGDGTIRSGEGFSLSRTATGVYDITFTNDFAGTPSVVATVYNRGIYTSTSGSAQTKSLTSSSVRITGFNSVGSPLDVGFCFLAIGPRY